MRNVFFVLSFLVLSVAGFAQQRTHSSFNYLNKYNFQKSYAGLEDCSKIFLQHKSQWVGVDDAPMNTFLQAHTKLPWNFGVGLGINRWSAGLLDRFDASVAVAKHFYIKEISLSPSVNLGYARFGLNPEDAVTFDNDSYLNNNRTASNSFYADFGFLATYKGLEVGVSVPQAVTSDPEFDIDEIDPTLNVEQYFNAHASYDIGIKDDWRVTPVVIYRSIPSNGEVIDGLAEVSFKEKVGVALGYRTNSGLLASANVSIKDMFTVGYAFDVGGQALAGVGSGSHEVLLGFRLCSTEDEIEEESKHYMLFSVVDGESSTAIPNAKVELTDVLVSMDTTLFTDSTGLARFDVGANKDYIYVVNHPDYDEIQQSIKTDSLKELNSVSIRMVHKRAAVKGVIVDSETNEPLPGVNITMADGSRIRTNENGEFILKSPILEDGDAQQVVTVNKEGYADTTAVFTALAGNYDDISVNAAMRKVGVTEEEKAAEIVEEKGLTASNSPVEADHILYFGRQRTKLSSEAKVKLDQIVKALTDDQSLKAVVNGYTSCTGPENFNQMISDYRTSNAKFYIQSRIRNAGRVTSNSYGIANPVTNCACPDCSLEEHAQNRRVEIILSK